jgi:hypothetical protein
MSAWLGPGEWTILTTRVYVVCVQVTGVTQWRLLGEASQSRGDS